MTQWIKVLDCKPDHPSLVPRTHVKIEKTDSTKLSCDCLMHVVEGTGVLVFTHLCTNLKCNTFLQKPEVTPCDKTCTKKYEGLSADPTPMLK